VLGCAGAYRIQGRGVFLAQAIRGSYSNVVGLPLETLALVLRRFGFPLFGMAPDR
jgi:septum formation protein